MIGQLAALITFIGFNLTFFPQFLLGYLGQPRRYHAYPPEFQVYHVLSTTGASILGSRIFDCRCSILPVVVASRQAGPGKSVAGDRGLEWQTRFAAAGTG